MQNDKILKKLENSSGYFKHNNCHIISATTTGVEMRADLTENSLNPYDTAHGGLIFGLGDTAMGMTIGQKALTITADITYLKPGTGKYLTAKAKQIKAGQKICFAECNIYNDKEELIATMSGSYYLIKEKEGK